MPSRIKESPIEVVQNLNEDYYLPGIQRNLVWKKDQIIKFFDSVLKNYPIGELTYWKPKQVSSDQILYRFIQNKSEKEYPEDRLPKRIESANVSSSKVIESESIVSENNDLHLVIDGQQRLNALLIGLNGRYVREYRGELVAEKLFVDLFSEPNEEKGRQETRYNLDFKHSEEDIIKTFDKEENRLWVSLPHIYNLCKDKSTDKAEERIISQFEEENFERATERKLERNLRDITSNLSSSSIRAHVEKDLNPDEEDNRVLEVFLRLNMEGEELSKHERLVSVLTNKWSKEDVDARKEINEYYQSVQSDELFSGGFSLDRGDIVQILSMLTKKSDGDYIGVDYHDDLEDFDSAALKNAKDIWQTDFKSTVKQTVRTVRDIGYSGSTIQLKSILPLIFYHHINDNKIDYNPTNLKKMHYFIATTILDDNNYSQYATKGVIDTINEAIEENGAGDFPLKEIHTALKDSNFQVDIDERAVREAFDNKTLDNPSTYSVYSLLYIERIGLFTKKDVNYVNDHIHPESEVTTDNLTDEGFEKVTAQEIVDKRRDGILNRQVIPEKVNGTRDKGGIRFKKWATKYAPQEYKTDYHYIPKQAETGWELSEFNNFADKRLELMEEKVIERFGGVMDGNPDDFFEQFEKLRRQSN